MKTNDEILGVWPYPNMPPETKKCLVPHAKQEGLGKCLFCNKKIGYTFKEKLKLRVASISNEEKQRVLDLAHDGKTIGEINKIMGFDTIITGEIIVSNLDSYKYLRKEIKTK